MQNISNAKCLPFVAMIYMSIMTCSTVLGNKLILTSVGVLSAASLVSPLWYIIGDIITEVYGFKTSMKMFWSVMICQFIFASACFFLIKVQSPSYWMGQSGYELVLGDLLKFSVVNFIGITIAWNINARLLAKWKILMRGKYFWLRSIGSSGIGLVIYSITSVSINVYHVAASSDVWKIVIWSCALKILYLVLLAFPATLIIALLYKLESNEFTDASDVLRNYILKEKFQ